MRVLPGPSRAIRDIPIGLRVQELRGIDAFDAVAESWNALCDRAIESAPTLRHAFLSSWYRAFGDGRTLRILLVWETVGPSEVLVGAAACLCGRERRFGNELRVTRMLANSWVDRTGILLERAEERIVDAILGQAALGERFDLLAIGPIDDRSPVSALIERVAQRRRWPVGRADGLASPFLRVAPTWEDQLRALSPAFRSSVRRKQRHAESVPGLRVSIVQDSSCLDAIRSISPHTWQAREGTAMTSRPEVWAFYEHVIRDAAHHGRLRCGVLTLNDEPVAFDFNIRHGSTLHSFKMGFREEHASLSPGMVLKTHLLQAMFAESEGTITEYDFMGASEPYKLSWASDVRTHSELQLFARTWRMAALHQLAYVARPMVRERFPKAWATLKRMKRG